MTRAGPDVVAIAWYDREDYEAVRALGKDGGGPQATFDEWLSKAMDNFRDLIGKGGVVERVPVRSGELAHWLRANDVESNEQTRARYVWEITAAKYADKH